MKPQCSAVDCYCSRPALAFAEPNIEGYWNPEIGGTFSLTNPSRGGVGLQEDLGKRCRKSPAA